MHNMVIYSVVHQGIERVKVAGEGAVRRSQYQCKQTWMKPPMDCSRMDA